MPNIKWQLFISFIVISQCVNKLTLMNTNSVYLKSRTKKNLVIP